VQGLVQRYGGGAHAEFVGHALSAGALALLTAADEALAGGGRASAPSPLATAIALGREPPNRKGAAADAAVRLREAAPARPEDAAALLARARAIVEQQELPGADEQAAAVSDQGPQDDEGDDFAGMD
jgi:hypothetical protein